MSHSMKFAGHVKILDPDRSETFITTDYVALYNIPLNSDISFYLTFMGKSQFPT